MIEALVEYIENMGFHTRVHPRTLIIYKTVDIQIFEYRWCLTQSELNQTSKEFLFDRADYYMHWIDTVMAQEQQERDAFKQQQESKK